MAVVDGVTVAATMERVVMPVHAASRMGQWEASTAEQREGFMEERLFTVAVDSMEVVDSTVEAADAANSGSMPKPELE
jgi:hypothetical protein